MYLKLAGPEQELFDVGHHLQWGTHIIHDGREELGDVDWWKELGWEQPPPTVTQYTVVRSTSGPDGHRDGSPWWKFGYATWRDDDRLWGVVSNHGMFIVGDDGRTIDRV